MRASILDRYDVEMRRDPPAASGVRIERDGELVRERGPHNLILAWDFEAADAERVVAEQAAFFHGIGEALEWKLYAHDAPSNLGAVLAAHGFEAEERETLLVLELVPALEERGADAGVEVRVVRNDEDLETYASVTTQAFDSEPKSSAAALAARVFGEAADTLACVAYVEGRPVAAGRVEVPAGRAFASLWGGGTDPAYRKRGVYRALVAERARLARARGYRYLTVDARDTSRSILERLGFVALTTVQAWNLSRAARP